MSDRGNHTIWGLLWLAPPTDGFEARPRVVCIRTSVLFMAASSSAAGPRHTRSSADRRVGCFHAFAVVDSAAVNIHARLSRLLHSPPPPCGEVAPIAPNSRPPASPQTCLDSFVSSQSLLTPVQVNVTSNHFFLSCTKSSVLPRLYYYFFFFFTHPGNLSVRELRTRAEVLLFI